MSRGWKYYSIYDGDREILYPSLKAAVRAAREMPDDVVDIEMVHAVPITRRAMMDILNSEGEKRWCARREHVETVCPSGQKRPK